MSLISDLAKTAVPVLGPTVGLANAVIRIGTNSGLKFLV